MAQLSQMSLLEGFVLSTNRTELLETNKGKYGAYYQLLHIENQITSILQSTVHENDKVLIHQLLSKADKIISTLDEKHIEPNMDKLRQRHALRKYFVCHKFDETVDDNTQIIKEITNKLKVRFDHKKPTDIMDNYEAKDADDTNNDILHGFEVNAEVQHTLHEYKEHKLKQPHLNCKLSQYFEDCSLLRFYPHIDVETMGNDEFLKDLLLRSQFKHIHMIPNIVDLTIRLLTQCHVPFDTIWYKDKLTHIQLTNLYQKAPKLLANNKYFVMLYLEKSLPTKILFYLSMKQQNHLNHIPFQHVIPSELCIACYEIIIQYMINTHNDAQPWYVAAKASFMLNYLLFQEQIDRQLDIELFMEYVSLPKKRYYNIENRTRQTVDTNTEQKQQNIQMMDEHTGNTRMALFIAMCIKGNGYFDIHWQRTNNLCSEHYCICLEMKMNGMSLCKHSRIN
eukprot:604949_1